MIQERIVSVIIPVYNERQNISKVISRVQAVPLKKEIIVVDDGSTDGTYECLKNDILPGCSNLKLFRHEKNQGKGGGIRTGLAAVSGDVVIIQDADLEYDPYEYVALTRPIFEGEAEVVYGSRYAKINSIVFFWQWFCKRFFKMNYDVSYLHHFIGIKFLNLLTNVLYNATITDEATCYKVFKTSVIKGIKLKCQGFEFCPEITAKVRKKGYPIHEVPISYRPRTIEEGKKLNWTHGFRAIWTLIKYRFTD